MASTTKIVTLIKDTATATDITPTSILTDTAPAGLVTDKAQTAKDSLKYYKTLNIISSTASTFTCTPVIDQPSLNHITVDFDTNVVKGGAVAGLATDPSK